MCVMATSRRPTYGLPFRFSTQIYLQPNTPSTPERCQLLNRLIFSLYACSGASSTTEPCLQEEPPAAVETRLTQQAVRTFEARMTEACGFTRRINHHEERERETLFDRRDLHRHR